MIKLFMLSVTLTWFLLVIPFQNHHQAPPFIATFIPFVCGLLAAMQLGWIHRKGNKKIQRQKTRILRI